MYDGEKIIKDVSFQINEVDYVGNGIKNIFIVLSGDLLVIRKDNFIEGEAVSLYKELISKKKTDISSKENFSKFHFQKICIIVGTIFSTILSLIFIKKELNLMSRLYLFSLKCFFQGYFFQSG